MSCLENRLLEELEKASNERAIQPFLKRNPILVRNAFNVWAWNYAEALSEFQLGAHGKVDFLILSAHSGNWNAVFIELKSPRAKFFTKQGVPGRQLNEALQQLDDRERWVKHHEPLLREKLSRYLAKDDVPAHCSHADSHQSAETEILDSRIVVRFKYVAVLGRRSNLTSDDQTKRASIRGGKTDVATYDRLVDVARKIDRAEQELATLKSKIDNPL